MKLITIAAVITYIIGTVHSQSQQHEHFPFPPKFQTPSTPSDNSLYLPPENHSPLPYYPIKNVNNLQFSYLPPTGTKAPTIYPTPFPMLLSSPLVPNFDDEDEDHFSGEKVRVTSPHPQKQFNHQSNQNNRTQNNSPLAEKKEPRVLHKPAAYRHPIDRADVKMPFQIPSQMNQAPASRRHMIVTAEMTKDQLPISDQVKTASYQGLQYIPAPPGFISSTTEPAIPILRLSNEMDLDGSFSYEALGADQTHYVQHSRMENMGTEKEEQVVEGSYSYVGDNGQTYTVHYVADSNGFRASGDHLPVPPPVPEIIQRAIQYNLAEEAKRPPHLKSSWEEDAKDNERPKNFNHLFSNTPPPPPRNLFTGKQPEAFSYNFAQQGPNVDLQSNNNNNNNNNNLVAAASNQAPVKTVDYTQEQTQNKPVSIAPISPQITFLASQGAHLPSLNSNQQSISRMYTNVEKAQLPQLMNYEAVIKENEQENNKALWRWQYGANANNVNPVKNSISRSSGEGDDVMINFSDMTQEDYTNMIRSQIEPSHEIEAAHPEQYTRPREEHQHRNPYNEYTQTSTENYQSNDFRAIPEQNTNAPVNFPTQVYNTQSTVSFPHSNDWYNKRFDNTNVVPEQIASENKKSSESRKLSDAHHNLITQKHFIPQSQTVTQSYDYEDSFFDVRKIKSYKPDNPKLDYDMKQEDSQNQNSHANSLTTMSIINNNKNWFSKENSHFDHAPLSTPSTTSKINFKFSDFIVQEQSTDFKPLQPKTELDSEKITSTSTTTEISVEDIFENNIFLKNLVRSNKNAAKHQNKITEESKQQINDKVTADTEPFYNNVPSEPQYQQINEPKHTFQPLNSGQQIYQKTYSEPQQIYMKQISEPQKINIKENLDEQMLNKYNSETLHIQDISQAEPKVDKTPKFISLHQKPLNEVKLTKMKPMDMSEVLNYVSLKNNFESSKIRPKSNPIFLDFNQRKELHYSDLEEDKKEGKFHNDKNKLNAELQQQVHHKANNEPQQVYNIRKTLNPQQQEELRGIIKNYKILHRNNNQRAEQDNAVRKELNTVPFRMLQVQSPNLPPLGRAGPTVKTYLPAIYV